MLHGRCATTAIALSFQKHPDVEAIERSLVSWFSFVRKLVDIWADVRVAWRMLYTRIVGNSSGVSCWNKVTGPIGTLIATLAGYGWHAP